MGVPFWMTWSGESQQTSALVMACFAAVTHCCISERNTHPFTTDGFLGGFLFFCFGHFLDICFPAFLLSASPLFCLSAFMIQLRTPPNGPPLALHLRAYPRKCESNIPHTCLRFLKLERKHEPSLNKPQTNPT